MAFDHCFFAGLQFESATKETTMKRVMISVGGGSVGVLAVTEDGQADGTGMGNRPGRTLAEAIKEFSAFDTLLLVDDAVFGTGYHRVVEYHGAGGVGYGFNLYSLMPLAEIAAIHDANVEACRKGEAVGRSPLAVAFDRLAELRRERGY